MQDILDAVREAARKKILVQPHAVKPMVRTPSTISPAEVEHVVTEGEIIEDDPDDVRGLSECPLAR